MKKILVVDDEPDIIDVVENRLRSKGYDVICANDGEEALHKIGHELPDLVILDVSMPVISGYDVCARIKSNKKTAHIPVLILTARMKYTDRKISEQIGADGFIPKPFSSELLMQEVQKFLNEDK